MSKRKDNTFWASYADLMTTLFFVMLALYGLTYYLLNNEKQQIAKERKEFAVKAKLYDKIVELQHSINSLEKQKDYFIYQEEYMRYELREKIEFFKGSAKIKPEYKRDLINIGVAIKNLIESLATSNNIRYLVLIEGMASKDSYQRNYELSYERAMALYNLWTQAGIKFDPVKSEIQIAGSGTGGLGRDTINETQNQRFLIQVIPKIALDSFTVNLDSVNVDDIKF